MSRVESCAGTVFLLRGRARPISTRGTLLPGTTLFRAGTDRLLLRQLTHMGGPTTSPSLQLLPVSFRCANAFVQEHHRHHRTVKGATFALAVTQSGSAGPCGMAIVGRPVARPLADGWTPEVTRPSTEGATKARTT